LKLKGVGFFLIILFLAQPGCATDLLTLVDFRRASQDQSVLKTDPFYPDSVWNGWVNEACCDLAGYGIVEKLDTIIWTQGTMTYSLNIDFIRLLALFPLRPTGKEPLNFIRAKDMLKVQTADSQTKDFWQSGKGRSAIVGFYPPPTVKDTFLIIYGAEAISLSSDTDTVSIPYPYRPLMVDYVVYRALLRDGQRDSAGRYYDSYVNRLEQKLKFEGKDFDVIVLPKEIKPE